MPFDPTQPANNSPLVSQLIRDQLQSLFDLIQSLPAGPQGPAGIQGPPFSSAVVDGVTTLNPGEPASVQTSFDGANVRFTFGIPRGNDGAQGGQGGNGGDGAQGIQGPPGEVSNVQLSAAIAGTSNNTNGVSTLGLSVSDPPTQSELQQIVNKLDELILNGRR